MGQFLATFKEMTYYLVSSMIIGFIIVDPDMGLQSSGLPSDLVYGPKHAGSLRWVGAELLKKRMSFSRLNHSLSM